MENHLIKPGMSVWLVSDIYPGTKMTVIGEKDPTFWSCSYRDKDGVDELRTYNNIELTDIPPENPSRGYIGR